MFFLLAVKDASPNYTWVVWLVVMAIAGIIKFLNYQKAQAAEAAVRAERAEKYKNRRNVAPPPLERATLPPQAKIHRHATEGEAMMSEEMKPVWQQEQEFAYAPADVPPVAQKEEVSTTLESSDAEQVALSALKSQEKTLDRTAAKKVSSHGKSVLLTALRDPASLKSFMIYREILSEPVALRKARTM